MDVYRIALFATLMINLVSGHCPINCKIGLNCTGPDYECPKCDPAYRGKYCRKRTECVFNDKGTEYRGTKNTTENGIECQHWSSQFPHGHPFDLEEANYCRNPDFSANPWCYTIDVNRRWMYCGVPECADSTTATTYDPEVTSKSEDIISTSTSKKLLSSPDTRSDAVTTQPICDKCRCNEPPSNISQISLEELLELLKNTKKALTVDKVTLSSFVRRKISARDDRMSATAMGYVGAMVIASMVLVIIVSDLLSLKRHLLQLRN